MSKERMELYEKRAERQSYCKYWYSLPERISKGVERFFYRLGVHIAQKPLKWILACSVVIVICIAGLFRFRYEKNPTYLWIPKDSDFVTDIEWLSSHYEEGIRIETLILTSNNVLEQQTLIKLNEITKKIISIQTPAEKISWPDVCMKIPVVSFKRRIKRQSLEDNFFDDDVTLKINQTVFEPSVHADTKLYCDIFNSLPKACLLFSILDIWNFNSAEIEKDSTEEIITKINAAKVSRTLGHPMNFSDLFGGVTLDETGRIIAAKAVKTDFIVHVNFRNVDMSKIGNDAGTGLDWATDDIFKWETVFLNVAKDFSSELQDEKNENASLRLYYHAGRSMADLSGANMFKDFDKLSLGIILMFSYVIMILSNRNWVECRFWLTAACLICIGGGFILTVGICSLIGVPYGPIHTSLPFLLLGLGVDDTFVIVASWKRIHTDESNLYKSLPEKIGLALGYAGSTITVTSLTDVVAFLISATTVLPALRSYCIYVAVGIFVIFLLQITFFVACFTLDTRRIEKKKNGVLPCIVHNNFESKSLDPENVLSWKFINALYSRLILTAPGKILVIILTIVAMSVGIVGSLRLEQWNDPSWLLPKDSYLIEFITVNNQEFSDRGFDAFILIGDDIDYSSVFSKIITLTERFKNESFVGNIDPWPIDFATFVSTFYNIDLRSTTITDDNFHHYLSRFLFSQAGGKYQRNFLFNETLECGKNAPGIVGVTIDFKLKRFKSPSEWVPAMDDSKRITNEAQLGGYATVWSRVFLSWLNDKLIYQEVIRNLLLALICVMFTTAIFIAELQTCFWILFCILLTLIDICGFMYFWGLTINMVTCIGLVLAVGLSVDYAAHIAHAFLNAESQEGDKDARTHRALIAVRHIGAAVANGAGSTWLAMAMLAFSTNYVLLSMFKIFFLVILFGLWHGLVMLPVILSTVGPRSLRVISQPQPMSEKTAAINDED